MSPATSVLRALSSTWPYRWTIAAAWVFALALYVVVIYGGLAQGEAAVWITDLAWTAAALLATHASFQAARAVAGHLRTAWSLFTAAFGSWLVGQLIWDWNELVAGIAVPFPSSSDLFYTAFGFLAIAALLVLREPGSIRRLTTRNFGNLGLIVCSLAVASTTALLEPIAQSHHSAAYISIALTQALSIVAAFVVSVYLLWSYHWGVQAAPLTLIVLGFTVHAVAALAYVQALIVSDFGASQHLNIAWLIAFGFQHCAGLEQIRRTRQTADPPAEATTVRERQIEALLPGLLLLSLVVAAAAFHKQLTPRVLAIDAALLALFAIILLIRESWMYARERRLKALLDSSTAQVDRAKERLQATLAELGETERALRLVASAGKVGIFEWDLRSNDVQYSLEWKRQLGYEDHEIGASVEEWLSRVHPEDSERALAAARDFIDDPREDFQVETRLRHRDGHYRWILTQMSLRRDADGGPASILGSHVDITRQKNIEAALRESETRYRDLAAQLERRVEERTAQLKDAYHELESFAYAVSHDLKAPLRAIDGFSHLLLESAEDKLSDTERDHIVRVRRGAIRMAALIDGLLAYSRAERRELLISEVHLPALLDEVLSEYEQELVQRHVSVKRDLAPVVLRVDREALMIVLRNLLDNALKFTRHTLQPRIELGVRIEHGMATMRIADNGIGFEQIYHDQIFSIFQRLHRNGEYEGTGIGLALARKAVQRMNGRLWAKSTPGRGAAFYVELPLSEKGITDGG